MNNGHRVIYEFGGFSLDPALRILLRNGDPVTVWPKVFDTLVLLLESRGRLVEKEELMRVLWPESFVEEGNLTQNIFVLRKILGDDRNGHSFIQTVPRRGYKFIAHVRETELSTLESDLPASYWRERSPFRGLQVFETEDAWLFFGRESETEELLSHLRRSPVLSVVGNSGSGKSSLLRAGLVPALQQGRFCPDGSVNEQWRIAVLRPSVAPLDYLAEALPGQLAPELSLQTRAEFIHDFRSRLSAGGNSLRDAIAALAGAVSYEAGPTRVLLMVDQFEELFTLTADRRVRDSYIDSLLVAASLGGVVPVHLVLAVRADFYPECMEHAGLSRSMAANQYNVGRMSHEQLRESIEKRLQLASAQAEAGLIDSLLEDVGEEPGNLALLEHALGQLWERCGGFACTLTNQAYAEIGRLRGALGRHADEVYAGLRDGAQKQQAKRIFLQLVQLGDGAPDTRCRVPKTDLLSLGKAEEIDRLLGHLASSRLISTGEEDRESFVEVSHEALIREWPLLCEWLTQDREDLRLERRLLQAAGEWKNLNRDQDALLQGTRLAQAEEWLGRHADVPVLLQDFVQTSICAQEEARAREQARQRSAAVRLRWFSAALALMLLLGIGAGWFVYREKISEKSRAMAAQSGESLQQDHGLALDLAIRSWGIAKTEEAHRAVAKAFPETVAILKHDGPVLDAIFSPDSRLLLTCGYDHTAAVWDSRDGKLLWRLRGHTDKIWDETFSPDGKKIATASDDKTARVWSAADGHLLFTLQGHSDKVRRVLFSADSKRIVTSSLDKTARVWDATNGRLIIVLQGHTDNIGMADFSPDGQQIVTAGWDGTARIWDSTNGQLLKTIKHEGAVIIAVFSPDGRTLATGTDAGVVKVWNRADGRLLFTRKHDGQIAFLEYSHDSQQLLATSAGNSGPRIWKVADGQLLLALQAGFFGRFSEDQRYIITTGLDHVARLWSSTDGRLLASFEGHSDRLWDAEISPDGQRVATASYDNTARLWSIANARSLAINHGIAGYFNSVRFSQDDQHIVTAGSGTAARVWAAADGHLLATLQGHGGEIYNAEFSPDGKRIVTASQDQTARVWNTDGHLLTVLRGHSGWIRDAQFSPGGERIVTASYDHTARVWNADDGRLLATLQGHTGPVYTAEFSPDGQRIVTASEDHTARIWNAADGHLLFTLLGHTDRVFAAQFSPDGQRIVTAGSDHTARIWDAAQGTRLRTIQGQSDFLGAAFSPDGEHILTTTYDETARIWDTDGQLLLTLEGHTDKIVQTRYSRDGQRILTASDDSTAKIWNAVDGRLIATLRGHIAPVCRAALSSNGQVIATTSCDGTVRMWQMITLNDIEQILAH